MLKYGARENLHGIGGDYHELHGSIVAAQYHTDLGHSLSMLSQHRLASMCQKRVFLEETGHFVLLVVWGKHQRYILDTWEDQKGILWERVSSVERIKVQK